MARQRGPRFKVARRFGVNVCGHPKALKRGPKPTKKMSEYGNTPIFVYPDGFRLKENKGEKTPWNEFGVYKNVFYVWVFSGEMTFQQFVDIYYTMLHQQTDSPITRIMIND